MRVNILSSTTLKRPPPDELVMAAWGQLSRALSSGRITRKPCSVCDDPRSEGHHCDYSKPLEVMWLCKKHHKILHSWSKDEARFALMLFIASSLPMRLRLVYLDVYNYPETSPAESCKRLKSKDDLCDEFKVLRGLGLISKRKRRGHDLYITAEGVSLPLPHLEALKKSRAR